MSNISGMFQDLTKVKPARSARLSSWDHSGRNQDYWEIPAGESITLGELEGPGCITHMWMTSSCRKVKEPSIIDPAEQANAAPVMEIHPALGVIWDDYDPFYYRKALIKITWDDQDTPSVLTPFGDFFCIGNSYPGNFTSMPFNVSLKPEEAGRYGAPCSVSCYFPMPFKKAKIEIINENELPFILYFYIDYEMYKEPLDEATAYFHASWHRENPCKGWGADLQTNSPEVNTVSNLKGEGNYVVLETEGTGHFVGCNLSVKHFQGSWWGEGNDMIFIDGEEYPSINGTGTEDYFNHAWGMQRNHFPFYGTIVHEGDNTEGIHIAYRFHITDPVRFEKSIKVTIEHGHANHLADDWSSTAYWYQTLQTHTKLTMIPVEKRLPVTAALPERKLPDVFMTEEMINARKSYKRRWEEYAPKREEQIRIKEAKARKDSKENLEFAKKLRDSYN